MHRLTYLLLILVLTTLSLSLIRNRVLTGAASQKDPDHYKRVNERFPIVDYDEQNLPDSEKNARRKEKQKRFNDGRLVYSRVEPWMLESVFTPEPQFTFPAQALAGAAFFDGVPTYLVACQV